MFFVIGPLVLRSSFSIRRIVSCGAAVGAVLLLEVAAAGFDGRERVAYVVSLTLSAECEYNVTERYTKALTLVCGLNR